MGEWGKEDGEKERESGEKGEGEWGEGEEEVLIIVLWQ